MRYKNLIPWIAPLALLFLSVTAKAQLTFDKPKEKPPLSNPYTVNMARPELTKATEDVLKGCKIEMDTVQTNLEKGRFITKPWIFVKGLNTRTDLEYVSRLPASEARNWLRGRYYLEIILLPFDSKTSQLQVIAHIEGQMVDGVGTKWVESPSNGRIEDEVLRALAGKILGLDLNPKPNMKRRIMDCEF